MGEEERVRENGGGHVAVGVDGGKLFVSSAGHQGSKSAVSRPRAPVSSVTTSDLSRWEGSETSKHSTVIAVSAVLL